MESSGTDLVVDSECLNFKFNEFNIPSDFKLRQISF